MDTDKSPVSTELPFRSIASRLIFAVLRVCALCTVLAMVVQGWQIWDDTQQAHAQITHDIAQSQLPLLTRALWDIEPQAVQHLVDETAKQVRVTGVRLVTAGGQRFLAGTPVLGHADAELVVPHPNAEGKALGWLAINFNRGYIYQQLLQSLLRMTLFTGLPAMLICVLLIRFLRRELSNPLRSIADYTRQLSPERLAGRLELDRPKSQWRDDLDLVVDAFKILNDSIVGYVRERDMALQQLAGERDRLDVMVKERTADLLHINNFLASVSKLSAQLIYLPLDEYPSALRRALTDTARALSAHACALAERDAQGTWHWRFTGGIESARALEGAPLPPLNLVLGWCVQRVQDASIEGPWSATASLIGIRSMIICQHEAEVGHLLVCFEVEPHCLVDTRDSEVELVAKALFGALSRWRDLAELERTRQELLLQSRSDPLTGLANRRAFEERKLVELRRARRQNQPISLIMLDIDYFKQFNDAYGHAAGDACLVRIGRCLDRLFQRPEECAIRLGGEEFAVLLPTTSAEAAITHGERIRAAVRKLDIQHTSAPLGRVSVSVGVASATRFDAVSAEVMFDRLMQVADEALYVAKNTGRDRVVGRTLEEEDH